MGTFSSGTLSIGRLSATLVRAAKAQASRLDLKLTQSNGQAEAVLVAAEEGRVEVPTDGQLHRRPSPRAHSVSAERDAEQQHLAKALQLLSDLRQRVLQLKTQVRHSPQMARRTDSLLCSFLGQEGLDAARLGDRCQQAEAWVLLLTGLSAASDVAAAHGCYEYPQVVHAVPVWPG